MIIEALLGTEVLLVMALAVIWGLTGMVCSSFIYNDGKLDVWRRRISLIGIWLGLILVSLYVINTMTLLFSFGWLFAMDRVTTVLPLILLPMIFVYKFALPVVKSGFISNKNQYLSVIVPIFAMVTGTLISTYIVFANPIAIPEFGTALIYLLILIGSTLISWFYQTWRFNHMKGSRRGARALRFVGLIAFLFIGGIALYTWSLQASEFPDSYDMMNHDELDFGGGNEFVNSEMHVEGEHNNANQKSVSVTDLKGPEVGEPDKKFTLNAQQEEVQLSSGKTIEAWTFNGEYPGPELTVSEGDLVEVTLINKDIEKGVTIHWHGLDVPNGEDGVAGMTQDAVMPGETYTYRFVVEETGTHWYHSHQQSSEQVKRGLFGALTILPKEYEQDKVTDITTVVHDWEIDGENFTTINNFDTTESKSVKPGTEVRMRLVNSSTGTKNLSLNGTSYKVAAIDGEELNQPSEIKNKLLKVPSGGRYDLTFTMPKTPVLLQVHNGDELGYLLGEKEDGAVVVDKKDLEEFDMTTYGEPADIPFDETTDYDREFNMILDNIYFGNYDGKSGTLWAINGKVFPNTSTFMVEEGDKVKITFINRSFADHPMHLHGHHIYVLSKNGKPITGSPLKLDTLNVEPGETYEVAFEANNPGIWMDHCHNLDHAAFGMSMHLAYKNVTTPFKVGEDSGNQPE